MNVERLSDEDDFDEVMAYATELVVKENKTLIEVQQTLEDKGLSAQSASYVVDSLQGGVNSAKQEDAQKDMLWGALWCVGGTIATLMNVGYIFWGAIVFGGFQFFRGLMNYNS